MDGAGPERVWVQVIDVDVAADREVTFGRNLAQELSDRAGDIRGAIEAGSASVAKSLLTVFLGNSHDDTTAESIGLAVLEVAVETSMR